jgi:hypothetical protein
LSLLNGNTLQKLPTLPQDCRKEQIESLATFEKGNFGEIKAITQEMVFEESDLCRSPIETE